MPAKELNKTCMECKDAEVELTVRQRQLCRYAIVENLQPLQLMLTDPVTVSALGALLHTKFNRD